jgi:hypothetical protein
MGYVHDTAMSKFISPALAQFSAGTWTPTLASNVFSMNRTAADAAFNCAIPIQLNSNSVDLKGAYLQSIDVYYTIATAAADDFATVELEKMTLPAATGSAPTGAAVTTTEDTGHDTAAERLAADDHKMTVTLSTAEWIDDDEVFVLWLVVDCAATTVFKLYGARANFTLRL